MIAISVQLLHNIRKKRGSWGNVRKYLLLILTVLFLIACNTETTNNGEVELSAHINIRDEIIGDSYQVMRIIEKAVDKDEKPEMDILFDYTDKYLYDYENQNLTDEEYELVMITSLMITRIDDYITIGSERRDFELDKEAWYKTLETGEYQKTN